MECTYKLNWATWYYKKNKALQYLQVWSAEFVTNRLILIAISNWEFLPRTNNINITDQRSMLIIYTYPHINQLYKLLYH